MSLDLDALKKKEVEFDIVLARKIEYVNQVDVLEAAKMRLENLDQANKSRIQQQESDINTYKQQIFAAEDTEKDLREQIKQKDINTGGLQARVNELQFDFSEQSKKLSLLDDKHAIAEFKLKKAKADIVDLEEDITTRM